MSEDPGFRGIDRTTADMMRAPPAALGSPKPSSASGAPVEVAPVPVPSPWDRFVPASSPTAPASSGVKILGLSPDPTGGKTAVRIASSESAAVDWSVIRINGKPVQGIAEIKPELSLKVDEKDAPGVNGSTVTIQGRKLAKFTIGIKFGFYRYGADSGISETPESQFRSIVELLRTLRPARDTAKPVQVDHPLFDLYGIREILITDWSGPSPKSDLWEIELKALEFRKPSSPKKSATTTPGPQSREDFGPSEPTDPSYRPDTPPALAQAEQDSLAAAKAKAKGLRDGVPTYSGGL